MWGLTSVSAPLQPTRQQPCLVPSVTYTWFYKEVIIQLVTTLSRAVQPLRVPAPRSIWKINNQFGGLTAQGEISPFTEVACNSQGMCVGGVRGAKERREEEREWNDLIKFLHVFPHLTRVCFWSGHFCGRGECFLFEQTGGFTKESGGSGCSAAVWFCWSRFPTSPSNSSSVLAWL